MMGTLLQLMGVTQIAQSNLTSSVMEEPCLPLMFEQLVQVELLQIQLRLFVKETVVMDSDLLLRSEMMETR